MTTSSGVPQPERPQSDETFRRQGLVLTAIGPDRPGLVKDLAGHLCKLGGNIEETRMSKLGGEFAMLILVTGEKNALAEVANSLPQIESAFGVTCFVTRTSKSESSDEGRDYVIAASGIDRPGIVESLTSVLAERRVNVTSFSSYVENAPLSGTRMFFLDAIVRLPQGADFGELMTSLADSCEREDLEFSLSEA